MNKEKKFTNAQLYFKKIKYQTPSKINTYRKNLLNNSENQLSNKNNISSQISFKSSFFPSPQKKLFQTDRSMSFMNDPEIDREIKNLYKKYFISKNLRKQSQQDFNLMNNKLHKLENEEEKAKEKKINYINNLKRKEKIQFQKLEEKELVKKNKEKIAIQLKKHRKENQELRTERNKCLKNFRDDVAKNNLNIISRIKNERKEIYNNYINQKNEKFNEKKNLIKNINKQRILSQENKKINEYEKKLILKKQLLKKIQQEEEKKKNYELGINQCQNQSLEIIERIRDLYNH